MKKGFWVEGGVFFTGSSCTQGRRHAPRALLFCRNCFDERREEMKGRGRLKINSTLEQSELSEAQNQDSTAGRIKNVVF